LICIKHTDNETDINYKKGKSGFLIGQIKELPAVFTQGKTIIEIKENILDVLDMYLEDVREQYQPDGEMILEEELTLV
jgi:predicted RNase H-like HicB family nuclease